jgi:hypothetical protein
MQTELKSDAETPVPDSVDSIQQQNWRKATLEWLAKRLAEPSSLDPQSHPFIKRNAPLLITCALIFFIAFGVRLLQWQDMRVETLQEDSIATTLVGLYEKEAKRMDEDGGVLFPSKQIDPGDASMLIHPPGYSILLRWLYGTEHPSNHYFALRMIQVIGDAVSVLILFLITAELFPFALASIAGLLAALSPHLSHYALWLSPDSLVVLPILLGVLFFVKALRQPKLALLIASGICFGLACWLRSNPLLLAPLFAMLTLVTFERGRKIRSAVALLLAMMFVLSPITIRNWIVYHRFIPLTIVTGLNLVQGLAEFDKEGKFGMPPMDADAMVKDAEWHNRPEYERSLWYPDGIERDQYRFKRGVEVIRANPAWFVKGMFLRMAFMLRYNDFRSQNNYAFTSIAPTVLPKPSFGHAIEVRQDAKPLWTNSAAEMFTNGERLSAEIGLSLLPSGRLQLLGDGVKEQEQLSPPPIAVKPNTDYILTIPIALEQGRADLKVRALDPRFTLQSKLVFHYAKKAKAGRGRAVDQASLFSESANETKAEEQKATEELPAQLIQIPFATGSNTEVRFVIANNGASTQTILQAGEAQLFEIGTTPYQWTKAPRSVFRGLQKNIFKTDTMRLLILLGLLLLIFARRRNAWLILSAVPVYYLLTHAAFSTEYRYILAIHFFLFVFAATALYVAGLAVKEGVWRLFNKSKASKKSEYVSAEIG